MGDYDVYVNVEYPDFGSVSPGHVWIEIVHPNGSSEAWGYYPANPGVFPGDVVDVGQVRDEMNRPGGPRTPDWRSPVPYKIPQDAYNKIHDYIEQKKAIPGSYVPGYSDCVNFADDIMEKAGLPSIPGGSIFPHQVPDSIGKDLWERIQQNYNNARTPRRTDPLDLDGDGIETVAANGYSGAMFDINNDSVKVATGWVKE